MLMRLLLLAAVLLPLSGWVPSVLGSDGRALYQFFGDKKVMRVQPDSQAAPGADELVSEGMTADDVKIFSGYRPEVMAGGLFHNCSYTVHAVSGEKRTWCWGANEFGQVGIAGGQARPWPVHRKNVIDVISLTAGNHTCAVTVDGNVWCWGRNQYGQLGNGTAHPNPNPTPTFAFIGDVKAIAAGVAHTCALLNNGTVKCWGRNWYGQLGTDKICDLSGCRGEDHWEPEPVPGLQSVVAIDAGWEHTCAVTADGKAWCWGRNQSGQVGVSQISQIMPAAEFVPTEVPNLGAVVDITAGARHTCATLQDGSGRCWGSNEYGQLGRTEYPVFPWVAEPIAAASGTKYKQIAAGGFHTCGLIDDGTGRLQCWGDNRYGQLGIKAVVNQQSAPVTIPAISGARDLIAGGYHTCVQLGGTYQRCWGSNGAGQIGNGIRNSKSVEIQFKELPQIKQIYQQPNLP